MKLGSKFDRYLWSSGSLVSAIYAYLRGSGGLAVAIYAYLCGFGSLASTIYAYLRGPAVWLARFIAICGACARFVDLGLRLGRRIYRYLR